jgi:hypothetical protein
LRTTSERRAIAWLRDQAEQEIGLKDLYQPQPGSAGLDMVKTMKDVLDILISNIERENDFAGTVDSNFQALRGERVLRRASIPWLAA